MESIDEFDVDISKLWKWKKEVEIKDADEVIFKAYLRVPGDADINRARVAALRESAKLRKMLRDENNFDRYAYILPIELIEEEDLLDYAVTLSLREFLINIDSLVDIPIPAKPDEDAPTEVHEEYQKKVDEWAVKRYDKIAELSKKEEEKIRREFSKKPKEDLYKIYVDKTINLFCDSLVGDVFVNYCIFYGLYKDNQYKNRFFKSYEEFDNLPTWVKTALKEEYNSLSLTSEELKK